MREEEEEEEEGVEEEEEGVEEEEEGVEEVTLSPSASYPTFLACRLYLGPMQWQMNHLSLIVLGSPTLPPPPPPLPPPLYSTRVINKAGNLAELYFNFHSNRKMTKKPYFIAHVSINFWWFHNDVWRVWDQTKFGLRFVHLAHNRQSPFSIRNKRFKD